MSTSTKTSFNKALLELKEINDQLFYKELQEKLSDHENRLEKEYDQVSQKAQDMQEQMERFEYNFSDLTEGMSSQFTIALQDMEENVREMFTEHLGVLNNAYQLFAKMAEEHSSFINTKDSEWRELAAEIKAAQLKTLQTMMEQFDESVTKHLNEMKDESQAQRKIIVEDAKAQLSEFKEQVNKQRGQFDSLLEVLLKEQQQGQLKAKSMLDGFVSQTNNQVKAVEAQTVNLEKAVKENFDSFAFQLTALQQTQQQLQEEQEAKTTHLISQQKEQEQTMKKWFIALVFTQFITIGSVLVAYLL